MIAKTLKEKATATSGGFFVSVGFFKSEKEEAPFEVDSVKVSDLEDETLKKAVDESVQRFKERSEAEKKLERPVPVHKVEF